MILDSSKITDKVSHYSDEGIVEWINYLNDKRIKYSINVYSDGEVNIISKMKLINEAKKRNLKYENKK